MGIKGLPEQLKHYHRDSRVEQFRGALASFFILCFLPLHFAIFLHRFFVCINTCEPFFDVVAFLRVCVSLDFTSDEKLTDKNNAHMHAL